jgi:flagellar hook-basal body complex protein FliE
MSGVSVRGGFDSHAFPPMLLLAVVALLSLTGHAARAGAEAVIGVPVPEATRDTAAAPRDTAAGPRGTTAAPKDSIPGPEGSSAASAAGPDTSGAIEEPAVPESLAASPPRARRTLPTPGRFDQPRWVMLRSLLVPGWGQVHNRAWIKAVLVAAGDGALRVRFFRDERRLNRLNRDAGGRLGDLNAAIGDTTAAGAEYRAALLSGDQQRIDAAQAAMTAANVRLNAASGTYNSVVSAYNALLDTSINRRWVVGGVVLYALIDAYVDAHFRNFDVNLQFDPALPGGTGTPGARLQIRWAF